MGGPERCLVGGLPHLSLCLGSCCPGCTLPWGSAARPVPSRGSQVLCSGPGCPPLLPRLAGTVTDARETSPLPAPPLITATQAPGPCLRGTGGSEVSEALPTSAGDLLSARQATSPLITRCNYSPSFAQGMLIEASGGGAVHALILLPWPPKAKVMGFGGADGAQK